MRPGEGSSDQGLSLEEYDSILEVAQNDPEVREKIRQRIRPSAKTALERRPLGRNMSNPCGPRFRRQQPPNSAGSSIQACQSSRL